jgi:energy-coupling factor transport system permease protein
MVPLLIARNPFVIVEVLVIVLVTRAVWHREPGEGGTHWLVRLAVMMALISIAFNVLTVHAGNTVLATVPDTVPLIGGDLTLNAALYGLASAMALLTLVLVGLTVGGMIQWTELVHMMPSRLGSIAAAGSVAWAFLPQMPVAWRQIREAQVMRGHRFRGARDFVPIIVPLLAGGLERSLTMAEALEARGFGGSVRATPRSHGLLPNVALSLGLLCVATAAFSLAVGRPLPSLALGAGGTIGILVGFRLAPAPQSRLTRYRPTASTCADRLVIALGAMVIAVTLWRAITWPDSLAFDVYPAIGMPVADPVLLGVLAFLLAPAALASSRSRP